MKNVVKKCRKKSRFGWFYYGITFIIVLSILKQFFNLNDDALVAAITLSLIFSCFPLFVNITYSWQPAFTKKRMLADERFKHYFNSCLKYIQNGNIEKAEYYYRNGVSHFYSKGYKDMTMFLYGMLQYMKNDIEKHYIVTFI